jgi:hypothetical protein
MVAEIVPLISLNPLITKDLEESEVSQGGRQGSVHVHGVVSSIHGSLRWSDEGTKTLVSRGNLDMSWGTLVP